MKITNVRAIQPIASNSPPDWRTTFGQILVAVDTDCGLTGYGVGGGGPAALYVVRALLRDPLMGRDPEQVEQLWQSLYKLTLPFGRKGLAIMALSGVDLALWDLRGKAAGKPVAELLGGRTGVPIPTYLTVWDRVDEETAARHSAFKLHLGRAEEGDPVETAVESVARARAAIGPAKPLMVDAWMTWDLPLTRAISERVAPYNLDWIEEPLPVDDLDGYRELARTSPIPIAGGEHEFTAAGFAELIRQKLHHVLQPDVCWCGGMTELVKIYRLAADAGLRVCPHRGAEIWGLHAIAALDPKPLAESGRPWMDWVGGQPALADGTIALGDAPGFGVQIDETALPVQPQSDPNWSSWEN